MNERKMSSDFLHDVLKNVGHHLNVTSMNLACRQTE